MAWFRAGVLGLVAGQLLAIFGVLFVCGLVVLVLQTLSVPYAPLLGARCLAVGIFALLGYRMKILTIENVALVRNALLRRTPPVATTRSSSPQPRAC